MRIFVSKVRDFDCMFDIHSTLFKAKDKGKNDNELTNSGSALEPGTEDKFYLLKYSLREAVESCMIHALECYLT